MTIDPERENNFESMNQIIKNHVGETLDYTFAPGIDSKKKDGCLIVFGHGVTGNKDRPVIVDTANALNQEGFDTLRFSFSGNGDSQGDFRDATISKEVGDLQAVIDAVAVDYTKIVYAGHSMGGAVGVLQAVKDSRIKALISIAGMIDTKAFALREFGEVIPDKGVMWEDEDCPLSSAFMTDLCETIGNLEASIAHINIPWLLLHGNADDVVMAKDTETVRSVKGKAVDVVMVEGADHSFNDPGHKSEMIQAVKKWVRRI